MKSNKLFLALAITLGITTCCFGSVYADNEENNKENDVQILETADLEELVEMNEKQAEESEEYQKLEDNIKPSRAKEVKKDKRLPEDVEEIANEMIVIGKSKLGSSYVYGSVGPNVFDCSGFTSYVYSQVGISIPRVASSQAYGGQTVSKADLQKGDLVFFDTYGGISHVGLYIGSGDFIHASSYGSGVVVSNLNDSYYVSRYVTAARYL